MCSLPALPAESGWHAVLMMLYGVSTTPILTVVFWCNDAAGRNILDHAALREQGFVVYALGKPLEAFLRPAQF
jgi:hypothetical protein